MNDFEQRPGIRDYLFLVLQRASMRGFLGLRLPRPGFRGDRGARSPASEEKIKAQADVVAGLENAPDA